MITSTHAAINALVARQLPRVRLGSLVQGKAARWFVIGGLAPDLPGLTLTVGSFVYYPVVRSKSFDETFRLITEDLFFNTPLWIIAHNSLHAPLLLVPAFFTANRLEGRGWTMARALIAGAGLHALVDVPVHRDDGPLLLFPFNWTFRFQSPVSYWDPLHFGQWIRPVDLAISGIGGVVLARAIAQRWFTRSANRKR